MTDIQKLSAEVFVLRAALAAIRSAAEDGEVCDDVAWFGPGETLVDFCDHVLEWSPDQIELPLEARP
jgi:hypothetical protein